MQKVYSFSKLRRCIAFKIPLFVDFANSRLPLKIYPFFSRKWYERGIRFDREWGGVECGVGCGLWGVGVRWVWVWVLGVGGEGVRGGGWGWGGGWGVFPGI